MLVDGMSGKQITRPSFYDSTYKLVRTRLSRAEIDQAIAAIRLALGRYAAPVDRMGAPPGCKQRREFMTLLGAAAAWPLASHAQQGIRTVPRFRTHPQRDLLEPLSSYAQEHESIILSIIRSTAFSRPEPRADMDKGRITDCFAKMRRARILSDRMVTLLREEEHLT